MPENYYAWTWGDALFVVLDVYRTEIFPGATPADGSKPQNWDWTLGQSQYLWMRSVLEYSNATHKFVFAHHSRGQGRGGIVWAPGFEWGGMQGNQYKFDQYRPGWGKPIQKVFEDTGVDIFFQGHDHIFCTQERDGLIYQSMPNPADDTFTIFNSDAYKTGTKAPNSGHVRVSVNSSAAKVEYFLAARPQDSDRKNLELAHSYRVLPRKS